MRIEHLPHVGDDYADGINGTKVAIVGYSHWGDPEHDSEDFSRQCIARVVSGEWKISFCAAIRNYFGFDSHEDFWRRVMFFNYVPITIGPGSERYAFALDSEIEHAKRRFTRLCDEHRPNKAFIFTSKVDHALPDLGYEQILPEIDWLRRSSRPVEGSNTRVYRMRHPQGANGSIMRNAVEVAMAN